MANFFYFLFVTLNNNLFINSKTATNKLATIYKNKQIFCRKKMIPYKKNLIAINQLKQKNSILFQKINKIKNKYRKNK